MTPSLLGDHRQQRLDRLALLGVAHAVNRRQQFVKRVGIEAHAMTPN